MSKRISTEDFINKAREVHGEKYDYSKVDYAGANKKVCIICPKHGEFWQTPSSHLSGRGCPKCANESRKESLTSTAEDFINKAREVHGDKYDYSKVEYVNSRTKVCIICPKHGEFWQTPNHHLKGVGCPKCGNEARKESNSSTVKEFINKAREVHGKKYDYSKVEYVNNSTKICIICPEHGEFWQTPANHLIGQGCPNCSGNTKLNTIEFIKKAREVHGEKYHYSKVDYVNANTKVCIICPEHGEFWQTPANHLIGQGCPNCSGNTKLNTIEFIKKAREVHGEKYHYSKVKYVNAFTKVCIICPEHGEFWQMPSGHLSGKGCPKCNGGVKLNTNDFVKKAREVHGDKYDYSKVKYVNASTKVCIICPEHGEFWQTPNAHLNGQGCPNCQGIRKQYKFNLLQEFKSEMEFRDFLDNSDIDILYIILRNMKKIDPKFDPITADIEKALKNIKSKDPIKALEEKYSKDEDDEDTDETYDDSKDDDNVVNEVIDTKENEKGENTNTQPTIEDIAKKHTEKEIKVISKIYPMLTPEDREYIKKKYLNDKLRYWMADREKSKQ